MYVKEVIYSTKSTFWLRIQQIFFKRKLNFFLKKKIIVCDLDNTLADTFSYKYQNSSNRKLRFYGLPIFIGVRKYVLQKTSEGFVPIFLSARPESARKFTLKWLKNNGFDISKKQLILVPEAADKIFFIKHLNTMSKLIYVDDLSYLNELGEICFYQNVIDEVLKMNGLYYLGKSDIDEINRLM